MREMLVVVQLLRVPSRPVEPEDMELKVEVLLRPLPNRLVNSLSMEDRSGKCRSSIRISLDSLDSFLSLGNSQDSVPDLQAVPHPCRSVREATVVPSRDRNLDPRRSRLAVEGMVVRDRQLVHNRSPPDRATADRVDRHLLPDRNR